MMSRIRQSILAAARDVFSKKGYSATTINEICHLAGVAPATIYRHFRSKKTIYQEVAIAEQQFEGDNPRRQGILEAALDVFSQRGYRGTTMTHIATRAGVSRATLYNQFTNKEFLLSEVLERHPLAELVKQISTRSTSLAEQPPGGEPAKELERLALQFLKSFQDARRVALLRLILAEGVRFPRLQRAYHHLVSAAVGLISAYLTTQVPNLEEAPLLARVFIGGLLGFVLTQQVMPGTTLPIYTPEEIARHAARQLLYGLHTRMRPSPEPI